MSVSISRHFLFQNLNLKLLCSLTIRRPIREQSNLVKINVKNPLELASCPSIVSIYIFLYHLGISISTGLLNILYLSLLSFILLYYSGTVLQLTSFYVMYHFGNRPLTAFSLTQVFIVKRTKPYLFSHLWWCRQNEFLTLCIVCHVSIFGE